MVGLAVLTGDRVGDGAIVPAEMFATGDDVLGLVVGEFVTTGGGAVTIG